MNTALPAGRAGRATGIVMALWMVLAAPLLSVHAPPVHAEDVYQSPEAFIQETFRGDPPPPRKLWIKPELAEAARAVLGHDLGVLRVGYWRDGERTAWILEEIGKERPITVGIVVSGDAIETLRVLIFRESRGWEVRYPFFTDQFRGAGLAEGEVLDRPIDGISGATLSVGALTRLARLALLLHRQVAGVPAHGVAQQ